MNELREALRRTASRIEPEYWVGRRYTMPRFEEGHREYHIYSFPGGGVRDSVSHPNPEVAYREAWARFCEYQRLAWDDHDQQMTLEVGSRG